MKGFRYGSDQGSFYILPGNEGWEATFGNESLGEFKSPEHAVDHLARGAHCEALDEVDTSTLEIPGQIDDWEIVRRRRAMPRADGSAARAVKLTARAALVSVPR